MFKYPNSLLQKIREFLEKRQKETQKRVSELSREDPFADSDRLNDNAALDTEASEQAGHERILALKKQLEESENRIKKALFKIKKGKYGFCEKCQKLIDTDRLEAFPMAELCLACEKKKEKEPAP